MRFLSFHCDYFQYETTEKSRSPLVEELTNQNHEGRLEEVLVLLISVEKQDETNPDVLKDALSVIFKIQKQLKVSRFVLLSFAHLFGELSSPSFALKILKQLESKLAENNEVLRPPFGWFNEFSLKAKGHPLSRMSRRV